ncbi:MAG: OmpA family protein [Alphaproteobacteria bacterium]|nr:OmpA family protein [Alphaproteobacteria bacterium]
MTLLPVLLLSTGCLVGKGKYDALLADHTALQSDHAALQAEYDDYRDATYAELEDRDRKISSLEEALNTARAESARLQSEIEALSTEKAQLLADRSALKSSVQEMEEALLELSRRKAAADARVAEYNDLMARFQALIDAGKLQVKIVDGRMVVELATDVLFAAGSANVSKDGKAALQEVAGVLASIPGRRWQIAGHTDNDPIATAQYPSNWELASARAVVVTKTLIEAGLPADRVSAASYGEYRPIVANDSPDGKASNRRIEIVMVPDLSTLPGFEQLQATSQKR